MADHRSKLASTLIGNVVGTIADPGAITVAFFRKDR